MYTGRFMKIKKTYIHIYNFKVYLNNDLFRNYLISYPDPTVIYYNLTKFEHVLECTYNHAMSCCLAL